MHEAVGGVSMIAGYRVLEALGASKRFQAFRVDMGRQADGFGILYLMHDVLGNADGFVETVNAIGAAWPFDVPDQRQYVVPQAQVWKNRPWFIVPDSLPVLSNGKRSSPAAVASLREQLRWLHEFQAPGTQPGEFAHGDVRASRIALVAAEPFFIAPGWVAACDLALGRRLPHTRADDAYHLAKLLVQTLGPATLEQPAVGPTAVRAPARERAAARPAATRPAAAREAPARERPVAAARAQNVRAPTAAQQVAATSRAVSAPAAVSPAAVSPAAVSPAAVSPAAVSPAASARAVSPQPVPASPRALPPQLAPRAAVQPAVASPRAAAQPATPAQPSVAPPRAPAASRVARTLPRISHAPHTASSPPAALQPAPRVAAAPTADPRVAAASPAAPTPPPVAASGLVANAQGGRPESVPPSALESVRPLERFEDAAMLDNSPATGSLELEVVDAAPGRPDAAPTRPDAAPARPDAAPTRPDAVAAHRDAELHRPSAARPYLFVAAVLLCALLGAALAYFARR